MTPNGCKQVTAADIASGWHFSGPLADQIRRKKISASSQEDWAQRSRESQFGVEGPTWVRLRWSANNWAKKRTCGWSGRAVTQWLWRKQQDQFCEDVWAEGCPNWYTEHQP